MKIAIASTAKTVAGEISTQGGRAPFYLIFDGTGTLLDTFKNAFAFGGGGAGYGVAKVLSDAGVSKVIVGKAGENMKTALDEANIKLEEREGSIAEILQELK